MIPPRYKNLTLAITGLIAGTASASLGIGGGVIIVPILTLLLNFNFKRSIATSLATIIPSSMIGTILYFAWDIKTGQTNILLTTALITSLGTVAGSFIGTKVLHLTHDKILKIAFAAILIFTSLKLLDIVQIPTSKLETASWLWLIGLGVLAGMLSGMLGIGGGVIIVPALTLFFVDSIHQAIPTSLCIIVPTTITGTLLHKKLNNLNFSDIKFLIPTAVIGAIIGVILKNNLPEERLKIFFGIFMIIAAFKMLLNLFKKST